MCVRERVTSEGGERERQAEAAERTSAERAAAVGTEEVDVEGGNTTCVEVDAPPQPSGLRIGCVSSVRPISVACVRCNITHFPLQEGLCQVCLRLDFSQPAMPRLHSSLKSVNG